jgi:hypothetical protein
MLASIRDWLAVCVCLETCDLTMYNFQREKPTAFRRVYHPGVNTALHHVRMKHAPLVAPMHKRTLRKACHLYLWTRCASQLLP